MIRREIRKITDLTVFSEKGGQINRGATKTESYGAICVICRRQNVQFPVFNIIISAFIRKKLAIDYLSNTCIWESIYI